MASDGHPDAQSDTLVTIPWTNIGDTLFAHRRSFADDTIVDHLYWSTRGFGDDFSIIGFPGEFKKDDAEYNKNQLIMVLTTAQLQRKALSLKDSIIMGVTGARGHAQIYSSYWESEGSVSLSYRTVADKLSFPSSSSVSVRTTHNSISVTLFK